MKPTNINNQDDNREGIAYERISKNIQKVASKQKIYFYCVCSKKQTVFYSQSLFILLEDLVKQRFFIYCVLMEKIKLNFSRVDYETINKITGGVELQVVKQIKEYKDCKIVIEFKSNFEPWKIQFPNKGIRNWWEAILVQKKLLTMSVRQTKKQQTHNIKVISQNKYSQQCHNPNPLINDPIQIKQEIFSTIQPINELIKKQYLNIRAMIRHLLKESSLCQSDQVAYFKDKLLIFQSDFKNIGKAIDLQQEESNQKIQRYQLIQRALQLKNYQLEHQNQELNSQIHNAKQQKEKITDQIGKLQLSIQQQRKEKSILSELYKSQEQTILKLQQSKQDLLKTNLSHQTEKQQLKRQIKALEQQISLKETQISEYKEKVAESQFNMEEYAKDKQTSLQELAQIKEFLRNSELLQKEEIMKLTSQIQEREYFHIFHGNILQPYPQQKTYLREIIEDYTRNKILMTKILFKFDRLSKTNFHMYVDNHPNLALIVKGKNGSLLAAFTEDPFSSTTPATRGGLIISLTNQKVFYLQEYRKSITYDDYYLIFGNSEIRLKSLDQKIFSNFGIANGFFNTNGFKVDVLLNDGSNRQIEIDSYEIHEIVFRQ